MMRIIGVFFVLLSLIAPTAAQVTFDAKNAAAGTCSVSGVCNVNAASSLSFTMTVGSIANGALVVPIMFGSGTPAISLAVTYNGVSMTAVTGTDTGINGGCSCYGVIYALLAPASGSHTVSITWTGSLEAHAVAISFSGVDQTNVATAFPHGTFIVQNSLTASPATTSVTSATNNVVVAVGTEQTSAWGTISGNLIAKDDTTGPQLTYASNYTSGATTVNPSFAFGANSQWSVIATDILASTGSAAPPTRSMMGVGK